MARDITIRYVGDSSSAERASRRVRDANDKLSSNFNRTTKGIEGRFAGMGNRLASTGQRIGRVMTFAAAGGVVALGAGLVSAFKAAEEARKVAEQTKNVIKTMGAGAWTSAGQINALSERMGQLTGVDDEVIQQGANMVLTFRNIRNEAGKGNAIFDRTVAVANDMSVAMGTDMQGASIRLGKALNDPVKGITALTRVGVQFTQGQKDQIKALTESGDILGAQKIILKEVEAQFGGTARAVASPWDRLKVTLGNLQEEIGAKLFPVLNNFVNLFNNFLPKAMEVSKDAFDRIKAAVSAAADAIEPFTSAIINFFKSNPTVGFATLATVIGGALLVAVVAVGAAFLALISPVVLIVGALAALAGAVVYAYENFEVFREVIDAVVSWVTGTAWPAIKAFAEGIVTKFQELVGWVQEIWPQIGEAISHTMNVIGGIVRTVLDVIQKAWRLVGDDILTFVTTTWAAIQTVISGFMNVISGVIKLVLAVINGEWGKAWEAVRQIVFGVWQIILGMIQRVLAAIVLVLGTAYSVIQNAASVAWTWVKDKISSTWETIKTKVSAAVGWVRDKLSGVWDSIRTKVSSIWNGIKDAISGVWDGIKNAVRRGVNGVIGIVNSLIGGINDVIDILPGNLPTIPKIGTISSPGLAGGGARDTGRDVPPQIAHLLGHGRQPGQTGSGLGDIPVISDAIDAIGDKLGAGADLLRRGAVTAVFGPVNQAAKALLDAVPWKVAGGLGNKFRETVWNWVKGEDAKLPSNTGGSGSARGLVGYAAQYLPGWKAMFPWMTIGGWRARGSVPGSDHPKGKALDLMTGSSAVANQIIGRFLGQAGAKYWIWNRQFASAATGWRPRGYSGPSPHTDHVHLSYFHNGGRLPEDITGVGHRTGRFYGLQGGETVTARGRGGGEVVEIHTHIHVDGREVAEAVARHTVANNGRSAARVR